MQIIVGKVRIPQTNKPFDLETHFTRVLKGPVQYDSGDLSHANFVNQNFVHAMRIDSSKETDFDHVENNTAQFSNSFV